MQERSYFTGRSGESKSEGNPIAEGGRRRQGPISKIFEFELPQQTPPSQPDQGKAANIGIRSVKKFALGWATTSRKIRIIAVRPTISATQSSVWFSSLRFSTSGLVLQTCRALLFRAGCALKRVLHYSTQNYASGDVLDKRNDILHAKSRVTLSSQTAGLCMLTNSSSALWQFTA